MRVGAKTRKAKAVGNWTPSEDPGLTAPLALLRTGKSLGQVYWAMLQFGVGGNAGTGSKRPWPAVSDAAQKGARQPTYIRDYMANREAAMQRFTVWRVWCRIPKPMCPWLLLSLDRLKGDHLVMTQQLVANMLGMSLDGVSEGALELQKAGLTRYGKGRITVLNRAGLEKLT